MPISNSTPATAIAVLVSQLPYNNTQNVLDAGIFQKVYYKLTNDLTHDVVVTFWIRANLNQPINTYYVADSAAFDAITLDNEVFNAYPNCPAQVPIKAGASYWVEVQQYGTGLTNPNVDVEITLKPYSASYPAGQVIIFSASASLPFTNLGGLPAGFIDPNLGQIVNFLPFFPSTEFGDILPDGSKYLINDNSGSTKPAATGQNWYSLLYDKSFTLLQRILLAAPTTGSVQEPKIRTNNATSKFWIAQSGFSGAPNRYTTISSTGVLGTVVNLAPFPGIAAVIGGHAALNDESYLLVAPNKALENNIQKWNLTTLAWDGTIGAVVTDYTPTDILVLADNTVVICYYHNKFGVPEFNKNTIIKRYNLAGTELNSVQITTTVKASAASRLGYARDPLYFWVWIPLSDGRSLIKKVKANDFSLAIDKEIHSNVYETTFYQPGFQLTNPSRIYTSDSCPIVETYVAGGTGSGGGGGTTPPLPGDSTGIYYMGKSNAPTPEGFTKYDKYHTTDDGSTPGTAHPGFVARKIPNPTIRLPYVGD